LHAPNRRSFTTFAHVGLTAIPRRHTFIVMHTQRLFLSYSMVYIADRSTAYALSMYGACYLIQAECMLPLLTWSHCFNFQSVFYFPTSDPLHAISQYQSIPDGHALKLLGKFHEVAQ
jgi:hypothetical protein